MREKRIIPKAPKYRFAVFFMMLLGYIFAYGTLQIISALHTDIISSTGIAEGGLSLAASICSLTWGVFAGIAGGLNAKFGGKWVLFCGLVIMAVSGGLFLTGPTSLFLMCLIRLIQGIGAGMAAPTAMTMVSVWFPKRERAMAQGCLACFYGVSLSLCTVYSYACSQNGWTWYQTTGWALVACGVVLAILVAVCYRDIEKEYGVAVIDEAIAGYVPEKIETTSGAGSLDKPRNWSEAVRFPGFWILGFTLFCYDVSAIGTGFVFPLFLSHCGFLPAQSTSIMSLGTLSTLVFCLFGGILSDKIFRAKRTPVTMMAFGGAALFFAIIGFCAKSVPIPVLIGLYFVAYGFLNFSGGPSWALPAEIVAPEFAQQNMGANLMFSNIGGALMITVIGYIIGATNATVGLYCLVGVQLCTCLGAFILHKLYKL